MSSHNNSRTLYCINFNDVEAAAHRIEGTAYLTPVLQCHSIDRLSDGYNFFFKIEAMQRTGSFKFRGALNSIRTILSELPQTESTMNTSSSLLFEAADSDTSSINVEVVTHSSGNHAQALARAAQLSSTPSRHVHATIVMPLNTPMVKKNAVQDFGGTIVLTENTNLARESEAARIVNETGALFIHPSEDPRVIAGQGTVCLEFISQVRQILTTSHPNNLSSGGASESLDVVIIPVGGGGLASGNAITLRALLGSTVKIVLAEPAKLDDAKRSFDLRQLVTHEPGNNLDSVADGLKTTLGPNTWPIVRDLVDSIFTVTEDEILQATKLVWERLKVCIEPSAGVGVAVALSSTFQQTYPSKAGFRNVGIVLCGGNVDILQIASRMRDATSSQTAIS